MSASAVEPIRPRVSRGVALSRERARGSAGGVIMPHRTLVTIPLTWKDVLVAVAFTVGFTILAFLAAPAVFGIWRWAFTRGSAVLALDGRLESVPSSLLSATIPVLSVDAPAPGLAALIVGGIVVVLLLVIARLLATRALPAAYFLRAVAFILATAVVVFAAGARPPSLELPAFTRTMLKVSAGIWLFVPLGYGLTLFLLDVPWSRKSALMAIALVHLALFIPLQQLVMLYLVRHLTLLAVPLVFVFGSVIPQIALLIALYSWAASWPERRA
jgi:hypothetical protein